MDAINDGDGRSHQRAMWRERQRRRRQCMTTEERDAYLARRRQSYRNRRRRLLQQSENVAPNSNVNDRNEILQSNLEVDHSILPILHLPTTTSNIITVIGN